MPVASKQDSGFRPAAADMPHEAARMSANLDAAWRFAGSQDHGDRAALLRIVDMNRQKAALVIVRVEKRQLLMAMRHVAGVAGVWDTARETFRDPKPPLGQRQQHDAAIRGDPAAVEGGCDFLAGDGWKGKGGGRIVQHGGRGWLGLSGILCAGPVDNHALGKRPSNMIANWFFASHHSRGGIFHSPATWRKTR